MRDKDVKPTSSRDLDIKGDYQLILRYMFSLYPCMMISVVPMLCIIV